MNSETILCAAVWYKDFNPNNEKSTSDTLIKQMLPNNCDRGIVLCGWRHLQCIRQMNSISGKRQAEVGEEIQGFLTSLNRFVDRKEGLYIAKAANQLNDRVTEHISLYSEDLY